MRILKYISSIATYVQKKIFFFITFKSDKNLQNLLYIFMYFFFFFLNEISRNGLFDHN